MQFKDYYEILGVEPERGRGGDQDRVSPARAQVPSGRQQGSGRRGEVQGASTRPTRRCAIRRSARPTTSCARAAIGPATRCSRRRAASGRAGAEGFDFDEIFAGGGAGGGFSDFFEELFGRRRARTGVGGRARAQPRGDTRAKLAVPLEAVYPGDSVRIGVNGRTLDVRVPKGIKPGQVIRLGGQGDAAATCCWRSNTPRIRSSRSTAATSSTCSPVAPWEAALGATISVPTLGGPVELQDPAGFRGRAQAAPARSRPAGQARRRRRPDRRTGSAGAARAERCRARGVRTLRDAFGDDWRRA